MRRIGSWLKRDQHSSTSSFRLKQRRPSKVGISVDQSRTTCSSLLSSMLTLYGLMILMLGVVIPISDALAKPVKHANYRQVFYMCILTIGIISIVYISILVSWLQRQQRRQPQARLVLGYGDQLLQGRDKGEQEQQQEEDEEEQWERRERRIEQVLTTSNNGDCRVAFSIGEASPCLLEQADSSKFFGQAAATPQVGDSLVNQEEMVVGEEGEEKEQSQAGMEEEIKEKERQGELEYEESGPQLAPEIRNSILRRKPDAKRRHSGIGAKSKSRKKTIANEVSRIKRKVLYQDYLLNSQPPKMVWSEAGVNLYLRLGAVVFGFGVMVHDGFKIAEALEKPESCYGPLFKPKQIIHLLYIICQTYYVFKYHRIVMNTQKPLIRVMMVHLITTNLCIWVKTVVYEIKVGLTHSSLSLQRNEEPHLQNNSHQKSLKISNGTDLYCSEKILESDPSHSLGPYLYPCAVEYGLICAAICYKFFRSIGDRSARPYGQKGHYSGPRFSTCHKSHKGLFFGLMIMMCILVPLVSLIFLQKSNSTHKESYVVVVQVVECIVLMCTSAMSVGGTITMIRQLKFSRVRGNAAFEVNLLFVGLAGLICYNLFVAISVLTCLLDSEGITHCHWQSGNTLLNTKLDGAKSVLEVVQSTVQTFFIMQAIQRKVDSELLRKGLEKPGRGVTIALLIANLAMWVASVFEAQRNISQNFLELYFGQMPWSIIKYICLPLIIFFRFHSTICLSEIWIHSYKLPRGQANSNSH